MTPTDTSEKGLETLIVESLVNDAGYVQGSNANYSREHVVDLAKLRTLVGGRTSVSYQDFEINDQNQALWMS